ncbi:MAG TPA: GNAT family N-acetyltransferase [Vicinamibacterales bacterium]|jgi:GNAT superfamily N-acetyltransferase
MTNGVSIRTARLSDSRAIAELTTQLGYEVPLSTLTERLGHLLAKDDQEFMVAELDDEVVGWVHVGLTENIDTGPYAQIGGLVVNRRYRKKRIGRALMERVEEWSRERGCSVIRLWSSAFRTDAHRFYEHLGYTNVKTQYSYVKSIGSAGEEAIRAFIPRVNP